MVKPRKTKQQTSDAEIQTDLPQNLISLTMTQLVDIIETKTKSLLAEMMTGLNDKTAVLQQTIDNCCTATLNQMKIVDNVMLEEKELILGLEEQVEVSLPEKISAVEEQMSTKLENLEQNFQHATVREAYVCDVLETKLKAQSTSIDSIEQQLKCNNVVIVGLPEKEDDNATKVQIVALSKDVMGISDITRKDIQETYRLGRKKEHDQPRNLLVKFKSKTRRDEFYKRRKRTPISSDMKKNIFINEDLTLQRARLYHDTRKLVKRGKIRFTWTQNGNIMIRLTENSQPIAVYSNEELQAKLRESDNSSSPFMDSETREESDSISDTD